MSFQESAQSWQARLHLTKARLPVLIGATAVIVLIVLVAGKALFDAATSSSFAVEQAHSAQSVSQDEQPGQIAPAETLRVHVGGAVGVSGVYELPQGACVLDAVQAAGGFGEGAAPDALNLAREVQNGEQILVPSQAALEAAAESQAAPPSVSGDGGAGGANSSAKVNLNTASAAQLDTLPGVGASTAQKIIAEREANGPFKTIEDLKRVAGIGEKKFAALSDAICVG